MTQPTRRTVLQAAAWTAPAIAVSSAAPAFAASGGGALRFVPGSTAVVTDGEFFAVEFKGASVVVPADALEAPALLTLTVTFVPDSGDAEVYSDLTSPSPWTVLPRGVAGREAVVFEYGFVASAGTMAPLGNGVFFGTDDVAQRGTFRLTFAVGGLVTEWTVATPKA